MPDTTPDKVYAELDVQGRSVQILESLGRLDTDDLRREAEWTGAESLWFGILAARAQKRASLAKVHFEILEARLDREVREAFALKGERTTEAMVQAAVRLDPRWLQAQEDLYSAEEAAAMMESAKFTLIRKDGKIEQLSHLLTQEVLAYRGLPPLRGLDPRRDEYVGGGRGQDPTSRVTAVAGAAPKSRRRVK